MGAAVNIAELAVRISAEGIEPAARALGRIEDAGKKTAKGLEGAGAVANQLATAFNGLAARAVGVNESFGTLAATLLPMRVGTAWTAGILAGITALGLAWDSLGGKASQAAKDVASALTRIREARARADRAGAIGTHLDLSAVEQQLAKKRRELGLETAPSIVGNPGGTVTRVPRVDSPRATELRGEIRTLELDRAYLKAQLERELVDEERRRAEAARARSSGGPKPARVGSPGERSLPTLHATTGPATIFAPGLDLGAEADRVRDSMRAMGARLAAEAERVQAFESLRVAFGEKIAGAIAGGIGDGIAAGVAAGSIDQGFRALSSAMLGGFGAAIREFGERSLVAAVALDGLLKSFMDLLPGGAIAKSIEMIAIGATLQGIAGRAFGGSGRGRATRVSSGGTGGGGYGGQYPQIIDRGVIGAAPSPTAGLRPAPDVRATGGNTVILIGKDDPRAQRELYEMLNLGAARGLRLNGGAA